MGRRNIYIRKMKMHQYAGEYGKKKTPKRGTRVISSIGVFSRLVIDMSSRMKTVRTCSTPQ